MIVLLAVDRGHARDPDSFHPLGNGSRVNAISADGQVAVGRMSDRAVRWVGWHPHDMSTFDDGSMSSAIGVSADGSVVVGNAFNGDFGAPDTLAFRWSVGGSVGLPQGETGGIYENYGAQAASWDGGVVVGNRGVAGPMAFYWSDEAGYVDMGPVVSSLFSSTTDVSADGSVAVGWTSIVAPDQPEAFRWTTSGGAELLGVLSGYIYSRAVAISSDASTIVGYCSTSNDDEAFVWTAATGMIGLGDLPNGVLSSRALAASVDGSVIVGHASSEMGQRAVIWRDGQIFDIFDLLAAGGAEVEGWTLLEATGVSADGHTIVGNGRFGGELQGWVATVPAPMSVAVFGAALALAARRRRA